MNTAVPIEPKSQPGCQPRVSSSPSPYGTAELLVGYKTEWRGRRRRDGCRAVVLLADAIYMSTEVLHTALETL